MKAKVNKDECIGCGTCESICPDVFEMRNDDKSHVKINPIPEEYKDCTIEAEESCPVQAISHEE